MVLSKPPKPAHNRALRPRDKKHVARASGSFLSNKKLAGYILFNYLGVVLALCQDLSFNMYGPGTPSSSWSLQKLSSSPPITIEKSPQSSKIADSVYYLARVQVGSEHIRANIDINSPDSWINATRAQPAWARETVLVLSHRVDGVYVELVNSSRVLSGSIGLGGTSKDTAHRHTNLRKAMLDSKVVSSSSYGVYVEQAGNDGKVTFESRADPAKYVGTLATFAVSAAGHPNVLLPMSSAAVSKGQNATPFSNETLNVVFDRSKDLIYLPREHVAKIVSVLSKKNAASYESSFGVYVFDCPSLTEYQNQYLSFQFSKTVISVPVLALFGPLRYSDGQAYKTNKCGFKVVEEEPDVNQGRATFGNAFLRFVYQFNDYDNGKISIAQANIGKNSYEEIAKNVLKENSSSSFFSSSSLKPTSAAHSPTVSAHRSDTHSAFRYHNVSSGVHPSTTTNYNTSSINTHHAYHAHLPTTAVSASNSTVHAGAAPSSSPSLSSNGTTLAVQGYTISSSSTSPNLAPSSSSSSSSFSSIHPTSPDSSTISVFPSLTSSLLLPLLLNSSTSAHATRAMPGQVYTFANAEYSSMMSIVGGNDGQVVRSSVVMAVMYWMVNCLV